MFDDNTPRLTPRQTQIAELISKGHNVREIALALGLTEGTVKVYTGHIYARLGIGHSHLKLALWWYENKVAKTAA